MKFLKAHWPTIVSVAGGVLTFVMPGLQAVAAAHPKSTVGVLIMAIIAAYNATAPKDQKFLGK